MADREGDAPSDTTPRVADRPSSLQVESDLERRIKRVTSIVAPTTVITALLFYYGYVATAAEFHYFGISLGSLGLSFQDYLLKSVAALYVPLGFILLMSLAGLWAHGAIRRRVTSRRLTTRWRTAAIILLVVGLAILARGVIGVVVPDIARNEPIATTPACLGLGVAAIAYARHLLRTLYPRDPGPGKNHWAEPASHVTVAALIILSLFWATNSFAAAYGRGQAQMLAEHMRGLPAVIVDSPDRLLVDYPGIEETRLPGGSEARFRYRYRGLRLLIESKGRLFLLPENWTRDTGATLVLPADGVRVQFYRTR